MQSLEQSMGEAGYPDGQGRDWVAVGVRAFPVGLLALVAVLVGLSVTDNETATDEAAPSSVSVVAANRGSVELASRPNFTYETSKPQLYIQGTVLGSEQTGTDQTDAAQSDTAQSDTAQSDTEQADAEQTGAAQTDDEEAASAAASTTLNESSSTTRASGSNGGTPATDRSSAATNPRQTSTTVRKTQQATTKRPVTAAPATPAPTTAAPTTAKPTTAAPTSAKPTTAAPTTAKPTTTAPTTAAPGNNCSSNSEFERVFRDDFNGSSLGSRWKPYHSAGNAGYGLRRHSAITVANGNLVITAKMENGSLVSGGMEHDLNLQYGKWVARVRTDNDPSMAVSGVVLTWPQSKQHPRDGENNIYETLVKTPERNPFFTFIHKPFGSKSDQEYYEHHADGSQFQTMTLEWTPNRITIVREGPGGATGRDVWTVNETSADLIPDNPHHMAIQLDAWKHSIGGPVKMEVDFVEVYKYCG